MTYVSRREMLGSYLAGGSCSTCHRAGQHLYEIEEGPAAGTICFACLARKAHEGADAAEKAEVERMVAHHYHLVNHRLPLPSCAFCHDSGRFDPA